ncbi:hypothetical protein Tco_0144518 [Tanacetum coccineum]
MASEQSSSGPALHKMNSKQHSLGLELHQLTPGYISSRLVQNLISPTSYVPPSKIDYEILFQPLFDEYFNSPPRAVSLDSVVIAAPRAVDPGGSPWSTTIDQDVPSARPALHEMNSKQHGLGLELHQLTPGYISSGLVQNPISPTSYVPPSKKNYEILFQPLFDGYFNPPPRVVSLDSVVIAAPRVVDPAGSPSSTTTDQDVPSASTLPTN